MSQTAGDLVEVRLLRLPLEVWQRTQEHVDGLLREFALIAQDDEARPPLRAGCWPWSSTSAPASARSPRPSASRWRRRSARGETEIDLTYQIPPAAAGAAQQLGDMLDEADEYCRRGDHLLTLATPEEELRFRQWFIGEFVDQLGGAPPTPWPALR